MSVPTTLTRTGAVALAGLAMAGVAFAAPAQAAKPVTVTGTLRPTQSVTVPTPPSATVAVCLRLVVPRTSAHVLVRPRFGAAYKVTVVSTTERCRTLRPGGSVLLHNYGGGSVRYRVTSSGVFA